MTPNDNDLNDDQIDEMLTEIYRERNLQAAAEEMYDALILANEYIKGETVEGDILAIVQTAIDKAEGK